jgi:hypothetical protein
MTKYVNLELKGLEKDQEMIINAVINEGKMRRNDEVLEKIERKITEAYAKDDRDLVQFLEELIRDLELDM